MKRASLFPMIRAEVRNLLAGYVQVPEITENTDAYIVAPGLGRRAGVLGAIAMARTALDR